MTNKEIVRFLTDGNWHLLRFLIQGFLHVEIGLNIVTLENVVTQRSKRKPFFTAQCDLVCILVIKAVAGVALANHQ